MIKIFIHQEDEAVWYLCVPSTHSLTTCEMKEKAQAELQGGRDKPTNVCKTCVSVTVQRRVVRSRFKQLDKQT